MQHHLETYLAMAEAGDVPHLPTWTEHEFRRYLTCGILTFGFARARCTDCRQERLVAFSCKGRCVCPSCTNRPMAEVATHRSDSVVPAVPMRLNPHPHCHLAVTDGLFARGHDDALTFHPARRLDAETARSLTPLVQRRILRLYVRRGLLTRDEAAHMLRWRGTGGLSLDASVRVAAHDRAGLERLLRGHRREALVAPGPPSRSIGSGTPRRPGP